MKQNSPSYAFLLEMIWVCAFFLICSCIFVLAFAKAEQISKQAATLNQAVQAASNAMESTFANGTAPDMAQYADDHFRLTIETTEHDGFLFVSIEAISSQDGSILYTLNGSHAISKGGSL